MLRTRSQEHDLFSMSTEEKERRIQELTIKLFVDIPRGEWESFVDEINLMRSKRGDIGND